MIIILVMMIVMILMIMMTDFDRVDFIGLFKWPGRTFLCLGCEVSNLLCLTLR